jgi:hypothetical protein
VKPQTGQHTQPSPWTSGPPQSGQRGPFGIMVLMAMPPRTYILFTCPKLSEHVFFVKALHQEIRKRFGDDAEAYLLRHQPFDEVAELAHQPLQPVAVGEEEDPYDQNSQT